MNRKEYDRKVAEKINAMREKDAINVYKALRILVLKAHRAQQRANAGEYLSMISTGSALEARIGTRRFDAIMDEVDRQIDAQSGKAA